MKVTSGFVGSLEKKMACCVYKREERITKQAMFVFTKLTRFQPWPLHAFMVAKSPYN